VHRMGSSPPDLQGIGAHCSSSASTRNISAPVFHQR
jgi:hypothetical protein